MRFASKLIRRMMIPLFCGWLGCGAGGCMTQEMWKRANETNVSPRSIRGFVTAAGDRGTIKAVVVRYSPADSPESVFDPVLAVPWSMASDKRLGTGVNVTDKDFELGRAAEASADFREDDPRHPGVRWEVYMIAGGYKHCLMIAEPVEGKLPHPLEIDQRKMELTLPDNVRRPAANVAWAKARAAMLTPITVVADAVLDPVGICTFVLFYKE